MHFYIDKKKKQCSPKAELLFLNGRLCYLPERASLMAW